MLDPSESVIYQLKIVLLGISPMIWPRILVSSDNTIEDLHHEPIPLMPKDDNLFLYKKSVSIDGWAF